MAKRDECVHGFELRLAKRDADSSGVGLHDAGVLGGQLDKRGRRCAATEALEAKCTGAGKHLQHPRILGKTG